MRLASRFKSVAPSGFRQFEGVPPLFNPSRRPRRKLKLTPEQLQNRRARLRKLREGDRPQKRNVLNAFFHDPKKQINLEHICNRVVALSQALTEKRFYAYQISLAHRIVESLLLHDGKKITSLMARQSGKTEVVGSIVAAIAMIFPSLAKQYPEDWRLNITDDEGVYRGFKRGISIGIYAPRMDQAETMFDRVKKALSSNTSKRVQRELGLSFEIANGEKTKLSNGSTILCQSASEQSKIEGKTHHLLIAEEAQDIGDIKMRKSLSPMLSSTKGTMVMIGTATSKKCDFYTQIKNNERSQLISGKQNHYFFPYQVSIQYNSMYREYIEGEKLALGEDSDEFRMSYGCEWIFERGMFVTLDQLFQNQIVRKGGPFSKLYPFGLPRELRHYSLVVALDWGKSHDSTVLTLFAVDWENPLDSELYTNADGTLEYTFYKKHIIDWVEFLGDDYETQYWKIEEYLRPLMGNGLKKIIMDSNSVGSSIFDRFRANFGRICEIEPFNFQSRIKSDAYKSFYQDITGHRLTIPFGEDVRKKKEHRKFLQQMLDLRKSYKRGLMEVSHPEEKDAHDDYPDSACLGAWGCNRPSLGGELETFTENFLFF